MHSSLAWIEWLDRLDRVLQSARSDVAAYARSGSSCRLAALQTAHRQLGVLLEQLQWMDPRVFIGEALPAADDIIDRLRVVLGTVILRLSKVSSAEVPVSAQDRQNALTTLDSALWDGRYEASHLLAPRRLTA
ncbi:MAG: hypothetical protein ACHQIL_07940 [Steroidobacterales bacterium]